jgi:RNA polymerase sigma-70 factor (ECF subfamily)
MLPFTDTNRGKCAPSKFDDVLRGRPAFADFAAPSRAAVDRSSLPRTSMTMDTKGRAPTGTRWSLVLRAGGATPEARMALDELCRAYRRPLRALAGCFEREPARAEELLQSFFFRMVDKNVVGRACPSRGRFRYFLRRIFIRHALNEKKGSERDRFDHVDPESWASDRPGADSLYNRQWAWELVDRALARLADQQRRVGKSAQFEALRERLVGDDDEGLRDLAAGLGMSEGALRVRLFRLRASFRDALRAEVAEIVVDPDDIDGELCDLIDTLRRDDA